MKQKSVLFLLVLLILTRLIPHNYGVTPALAVVMMGAHFNKVMKWVASVAYIATDIALNLIYTGNPFYLNCWMLYLFIVVLSLMGSRSEFKSWVTTTLSGIGMSLVFFWVTNSIAWLSQALPYGWTVDGYIACLKMGLPFYKYQFFTDPLYCLVLYYLLEWKFRSVSHHLVELK